jgi:hypothetical protein
MSVQAVEKGTLIQAGEGVNHHRETSVGEVIDRARARGVTWPKIAADFGSTEDSVRNRWRRWKQTTLRALKDRDTGVPPETRPALLDELQSFVHPAPFAVTYPKGAKSIDPDGSLITGVIYGDTHGQFLDEKAEAVLFAVMADLQPQRVVHVGDAVDCYTISAFDKDPLRKESLQDEIDHARRHLARARAVVPDAAFWLLEGNHEDRLRRTLWNATQGMREVSKLRAFQDAITWPNLLQLEALGIEWVGTKDQPIKTIFPKFIIKHGTVVRKWSGWSAKGEWEKYGKSGASGHVHRLAQFLHRDWNGNHVWAETGCLCGLNPDYTQDPDWQQGFVVVTFEAKTGAFQVEPVYIHQGRAVWRGRVYTA